MRDESLIRMICAADAADPEDIFLRASLALAMCNTHAAAAPDEDEHSRTVGHGTPPARRSIAPSRPHYGWAIAASLVAVVTFGAGVLWGGQAPSERADLLEEVAGYHEVYSRETAHLVEVPASET